MERLRMERLKMKIFPKMLGLIVAIILFTAINIFADQDEQWKYSKEVTYENKEEVKAIYLDEEVYPHAKKDLSDIRLINDKNEFVPYYVYNRFISTSSEEYTEYTSKEILSFMKNNNYYADYEVKPIDENTDVIGNIIMLEVPKDTFYKEVEILGSHDNKTWEKITSDIVYNINGQSKTQVPLEGDYKYLYYRVISVGDTGETPISHLTLIYDYTESTYEQYKKSKKIEYKVEVDKVKKETIVKIHNKDSLRISNIQLKSSNDFNRKYNIYAANNEEEKVQQIAMGSIYKFSLEEIKIEDMNIPLKETIDDMIAPEYLEIVIKDQDDKPIDIEEIEITYYIDKIVFKTNDSKGIKLLFGNALAKKPNYDISSYIVEIEKSKQEMANLLGLVEREVEEITVKTSFNFKWILNISVIVISGLLVIVILKKK